MADQNSIGITQLNYKLPSAKLSLDQLAKEGRLKSKPSLMAEFGFANCYESKNFTELEKLIIDCGQEVLDKSELSADKIDSLYLYSGINQARDEKDLLEHFIYTVFKAHHAYSLDQANPMTISQQGCSGLLSTIDMASKILRASSKEATLILAGDMLPSRSNREIMYNLMSDAAGSILVTKNAKKNKILHYYQKFQSYYWNTPEHEHELLAAYFPLAQRTIIETLKQVGLKVADIKWFIPHNVSLRSWQILSQLLEVSPDRIWNKNISRIGHTISCDHIINLKDMEVEGVLNPGDLLCLFTFGFGATWSCMILEH